ncbi:ImmA/IrrE family metallo-endopeptidase [Streptoalloteichus hindustanus]|uniref:Uncharacterized protein n=1 Tax=Streptoalloteichus hindustanus TaxID=2017 RepID=A0A1M5NZE2_STRHI|nr:ImmA/IrrE family metallo-endopeptidase [Streptoalloteichus hindustanus]SHG94868.1 protein of unknown function [Streptoalloteichus hindustanus]
MLGAFREHARRYAGEARLRRRLRREFEASGIDGPADMAEVCARLSRRRGKPIHLLPYSLTVPTPFGLWLGNPAADYIVYQSETTPTHQQHIIAHELGHMLAGHHSDEDDDEVWRELMPDIPPDRIRRALRRTSYDDQQEREAEVVATLLLETTTRHRALTLPARSEQARRLQATLSDRRWL